jgi:hypothetical protein
MKFEPIMQTRTVERLSRQLKEQYQITPSWRDVARACNILTTDGRPDPALADRIATKGYDPKRQETRQRLGLSAFSAIVVIGDGDVPEGSQAVQAIQCDCGNWFITNHPRRKHCFICRPFRGHHVPRFTST